MNALGTIPSGRLTHEEDFYKPFGVKADGEAPLPHRKGLEVGKRKVPEQCESVTSSRLCAKKKKKKRRQNHFCIPNPQKLCTS